MFATNVRNRRFLVSEIGSSVSRGTKANNKFDLVRAGDIVYWKTSEMRRERREKGSGVQESRAESRRQDSSLYCRLKSKLESKDLR